LLFYSSRQTIRPHCIRAGLVIVASVVLPNPITIDSVVQLVSEIYDKCYKKTNRYLTSNTFSFFI